MVEFCSGQGYFKPLSLSVPIRPPWLPLTAGVISCGSAGDEVDTG